MIYELELPRREATRMSPPAAGAWLEEIRRYWATRAEGRAADRGAVVTCTQRAVAEAVQSLEEIEQPCPR